MIFCGEKGISEEKRVFWGVGEGGFLVEKLVSGVKMEFLGEEKTFSGEKSGFSGGKKGFMEKKNQLTES